MDIEDLKSCDNCGVVLKGRALKIRSDSCGIWGICPVCGKHVDMEVS